MRSCRLTPPSLFPPEELLLAELHATYLTDRHMFALWRWPASPSGRAPDVEGEPHTVALALPTTGRSTLEVVATPCIVVEPDALPTNEKAGGSLTAWLSTLEHTDHALPVAAHAIPNPTRTAIDSAHYSRTTFTRTVALGAELESLLHADLRPYQVRGIDWLDSATAEHGGAILADEMGLGKTLQAIGHLRRKADSATPQLVICPTSLVGNWEHEIAKFAPDLHAVGYRGGAIDVSNPRTVVVAGYPTLRLHTERLVEQSWATVVFDEAQVLKNPRTQVSRAARKLPAAHRIALTGTPVENHLDELWALLNLVTPQLFSHKSQFRRRFTKPIEAGSASAMNRMLDAIEPVLLARKKIHVAASLPSKIHSDLLCDLTDEQERVYDRVLHDASEGGFGSGAQRQARVLAALTALKQVCNHPGLVTGDLVELADRSGKLELCVDIVANNLETDSPTLIFTQYRTTGEILVLHLSERFGITAPFFHGGLNQRERAAIVAEFQAPDGPPVLVLSVKAAGTGLTLTRAADVIHFDRWWNPAVEAQATDRVHRIGQTRTVTVTTLTSTTTLEEHIARMHDRKSTLVNLTDPTGKAGVAELARLDDDHLIDILRRKRENA